MNLMINAQHAMEPNGGELYISTLQANGFAEIHLRDTGKGIAPEVKARIFEPFFTTKPAGKGTGLGLSVTFGIIKDHQGEVIVESEVGKGTEFIIRIPSLVGQAQVSASDEDKKAQAGGNATSTSGPGEAGINV
jgi:signal transduction histidine kinase